MSISYCVICIYMVCQSLQTLCIHLQLANTLVPQYFVVILYIVCVLSYYTWKHVELFTLSCIYLHLAYRPCLCGEGDSGCFWCGACRVCANVEIPPEHPLQKHQMWDYSTAREQAIKLYRASYKGHLPLTGQGEPHDCNCRHNMYACYLLCPLIHSQR